MEEIKPARIDRRIQRTRQALHQALLALMTEKAYASITIEEITDRANLGRTTFYLHYKDKEDLLLEEFANLVDDVIRQVVRVPLARWQEQRVIRQLILLFFVDVINHREIYQVLIGASGGMLVHERFRRLVMDAANGLAATRSEVQLLLERGPVPSYFFINYFSGALLATIEWWIDQDLQPGAEEMAALFQKMIVPGMRAVLGI